MRGIRLGSSGLPVRAAVLSELELTALGRGGGMRQQRDGRGADAADEGAVFGGRGP
jgi:hypothetical protein